MTAKKETAQMMADITSELKVNEELFKRLPLERLANITSGLFSLCIRLAAISPSGVSIIATTGVLREANSLVKAYNNDKQLKIKT